MTTVSLGYGITLRESGAFSRQYDSFPGLLGLRTSNPVPRRGDETSDGRLGTRLSTLVPKLTEEGRAHIRMR